VEPGSPAAKAGIREQDVIVSYDGKPIARSDDLVNAVADTPVGTQVKLGIIRDGKRIEIPVTVGDRAEIYRDNPLISGRRSEDSSREGGPESKFGMYVRNADPAELEGSGESAGVLVTRVDPASFADDIGIQPGDVITSVNREPVRSVDDLRRIQATLKPGSVVAFRVLRPAARAGGRGGRTWNTFFPAGTLPQK
jgi:serine protease Do